MPKRVKVIACDVLQRETCACAASSPLVLDLEFLPKGLHDLGSARMSERLQEALGAVDPERYEAAILCYGLCNNGVVGLSCRTRLVLPRAHDCITLLLGSRERYRETFALHPGTYYKSPGWIERGTDGSLGEDSLLSQLGLRPSREDYAELYGEENADYLAECLGDWYKSYDRMVFLDTGLGDRASYRERVAAEASRLQLAFEEVSGDLSLLRRLLSGDWGSEDFLVLEPGERVEPTFGLDIVGSDRAQSRR
jgi:hypothetical protein